MLLFLLIEELILELKKYFWLLHIMKRDIVTGNSSVVPGYADFIILHRRLNLSQVKKMFI